MNIPNIIDTSIAHAHRKYNGNNKQRLERTPYNVSVTHLRANFRNIFEKATTLIL